jgi:hypothetical protein
MLTLYIRILVHFNQLIHEVKIVKVIFTYIPCILIIIKVFSPTDAQFDSLKNKFKFALKFTLKGSYMFRCEKTPSSGSILFGTCQSYNC